MDMNRHEFQLDDLIERIKANDNRLVALQVPEGLKMQALEMMAVSYTHLTLPTICSV